MTKLFTRALVALAFTFALTGCEDDTGVDLETPAAIESDAADIGNEVEADMQDAAAETDAALEEAGDNMQEAGADAANAVEEAGAEAEAEIEGVE
ncbi:hypothetical protein [Rubricoccus marinus]|uniref:Pterin-binding domain-containing protein n=1 Tax=Rubricoccus marinus TaxID=716817 RepID=A0A259TYK7_9BACT|nr:hypothetical protein [Rubricoccus marinus]OZC02780.1 hypothetical protein BSZ36_07210 [Rubricoccus marinus]